MNLPVISADSHITEPPNTYTDYMDAAWRDNAPHMEHNDSSATCSSSPA
jgi:hypothetical protein